MVNRINCRDLGDREQLPEFYARVKGKAVDVLRIYRNSRIRKIQVRMYYTRTHIHTYTHTHIHTHPYIHTHTHTHIHPYTHTHIHIHTHTHTPIHKYIYIYLIDLR